MPNNIIDELQSAKEWFTEHGRNTNTAIIGICDRAIKELTRQKAEIERLNKILHMDFMIVGSRANGKTEMMKNAIKVRVDAIKAEAIKEFVERAKTKRFLHYCKSCKAVIEITSSFNDALDIAYEEMVGETE